MTHFQTQLRLAQKFHKVLRLYWAIVFLHNFQLKFGTHILFLKDLDPPMLDNLTRLFSHVIETFNLIEAGRKEVVFIPRTPIIPKYLFFKFKPRQFTLVLSFDIIVNKVLSHHAFPIPRCCLFSASILSRPPPKKKIHFIFAPKVKSTNWIFYATTI